MMTHQNIAMVRDDIEILNWIEKSHRIKISINLPDHIYVGINYNYF